MNDMETRILDMAKRAADAKFGAKRRAFARLQAEAPDVAEFMRSVANVFGRPSSVRIDFSDGTIFSTGKSENER